MKLPRAAPGTTVVIAADVWNALAAAVEKANNFTVSAPLHMSESPSGRALSLLDSGHPVIPVLLTKNGGVDGTDKSAVCTNAFDIYDAYTDPSKTTKLNTGAAITPLIAPFRALKLQLTTASDGLAYRKSDGSYVLIITNEKPVNEKDCT